MRILIALIWTSFMLASASVNAAPKQKDIDAYRALVAQDERLATAGYRLAKANAAFCTKKERNPGWVLHSYRQYPDRETAKTAFDFPTPVSVAALVPGGPAQNAGIRVGDGFVGLGSRIFWGGERIKHKPSSALIDGINIQLRNAFAGDGEVELEFESLEGPLSSQRKILLDPPLVCASSFVVSTGGKADAGADGERVRISVKLAEFTPDKDEFAAIVAHELAHNILGHRAMLDAAKTKRGLGRMFGKSKKLIRQTEVEADQLSIWLMANAGYDPAAALRFIERYGRKYGYGIFSDGTHYRWKKRRKFMQAELDKLANAERGEQGYFPPLLMTGVMPPSGAAETK